jgi:hypothetical protein
MSMTPKQIEQAVEALRQMKHFEDIIERLTERDVMLSGDLKLEVGMGGGSGWIYQIGYPDDLRKVMTTALIKWAENKYLAARKEALLCGVELEHSKSDPPLVTFPNHDCIDMSKFVVIDYTNWNGVRRKRAVMPVGIYYSSDEKYHPQKQWLMEAVDLEDNYLEVSETGSMPSTKMFAMQNIHSWEPYMGPRS